MIHLKWQGYWCTIAPMGNISELSRQIFHSNDKKKWTQHRCLMYSYWNVNWVAVALYDSDFSMSIVIRRLENLNNPFINFKFPHCPRKNYFYNVHDRKPFLGQQMQSRCFFSLTSTFLVASVVPLPGMKPNYMLLIETCSLVMVLRISEI